MKFTEPPIGIEPMTFSLRAAPARTRTDCLACIRCAKEQADSSLAQRGHLGSTYVGMSAIGIGGSHHE